MTAETYPLFLRLRDKRVLVVGAGPVAAGKLDALLAAGAAIVVVAPEVSAAVRALAEAGAITVRERDVEPRDVEDAWFVVAAAPPEVNRRVHGWADARRTFVLAVDDVPSTDAFSPAVFVRGGLRVALSSEGRAPALIGLLREALEHALPDGDELERWMQISVESRTAWKRDGVPLADCRMQLLERLVGPTLAAARTEVPPDVLPGPPLAIASGGRPPGDALPPPRAAGSGCVTLVGAGPGAADLLTVRAVRVLESADIVFYDALVSEELLALAPQATLFFVGKRAGRPSMSQEAIIRLLIKSAQRGQRVVRLKAGDPFVFGRGGEEALALAREGVRFEVVPGVSAAFAAPAAAGIPVTHRGAASGMVLLTGEPEDTWRQVVADLTPGSLTVVMLMGLRKRAQLADALLARGWSASTPIAIVLAATTPSETRVFATLAELGTVEIPAVAARAPGVIVVGEVVHVAHELEALAAELEGVA